MAAAAARSLAAAGCSVRWLAAAAPGSEIAAEGVEVVAVPRRAQPFRRVRRRSEDRAMDLALARTLRARPADVVHDFGFGAPGSAGTLWIAERMGSRAVATVRAAEVLCHRQTLIDGWGSRCDEFADPARCTGCCLRHGGGGLSPAAARVGRALRWLGRISPFPNPGAFKNRTDLILGGLALAGIVFVGDEADAALLSRAGLQGPSIRCLDGDAGDGALPAYRELVAG